MKESTDRRESVYVVVSKRGSQEKVVDGTVTAHPNPWFQTVTQSAQNGDVVTLYRLEEVEQRVIGVISK